jgi:hypothetical protein
LSTIYFFQRQRKLRESAEQSVHKGKALKSQFEKQNFMFQKKELIFSTYLSSRAKNVRFITRAALSPPPCTLDKPSFLHSKINK